MSFDVLVVCCAPNPPIPANDYSPLVNPNYLIPSAISEKKPHEQRRAAIQEPGCSWVLTMPQSSGDVGVSRFVPNPSLERTQSAASLVDLFLHSIGSLFAGI
ncbi:hypothetical protein N7475_008572 [Penicillium sp. IBT 31633x]|nr:hypothetical protein N7475_008572 [Penicillium sp. IBT 31633x]